jgi:hypothetical protein
VCGYKAGMPRQKPRGRPRKKNPKSERAVVRCTPAEKERWFDAAIRSEAEDFSEWARRLLNEAANQQM